MYIVLYDYNCNGKNFIAGNIINPNICSAETLNYLLSIGAIKSYNKSNQIEKKDNKVSDIIEEVKEEILKKEDIKEIKRTKNKSKRVK